MDAEASELGEAQSLARGRKASGAAPDSVAPGRTDVAEALLRAVAA